MPLSPALAVEKSAPRSGDEPLGDAIAAVNGKSAPRSGDEPGTNATRGESSSVRPAQRG